MAKSGETLLVLGIETSCDETAAAMVRRDAKGSGAILSNIVRSQLDLHADYGGVVPGIAARAHIQRQQWVICGTSRAYHAKGSYGA